MFWTFAQTPQALGIDPGWAQLAFGTVVSSLFIFIVTRGVPRLLDKQDARTEALITRADQLQTEAREHYEKIFDKMEAARAANAKDGHDAARRLVESLDKHTEAVRSLAQSHNNRG